MKSLSRPDYSVVIPAFNAAGWIAETLHSVLAQSVPPAEVIVVDDGSTDDTGAVAAAVGAPVRVIRTPNGGAGAATTLGIAESVCEIVATVDSDDLWLPEKMARQLPVLTDASRPADAVLCRLEPFGEVSSKSFNTAQSGWSRSALVLTRAAFARVGKVQDFDHGYGEMVDWFARARETGLRFVVLDEVLVRRRIHPGSISYQAAGNKRQQSDFLKAAIRALERRNQAR